MALCAALCLPGACTTGAADPAQLAAVQATATELGGEGASPIAVAQPDLRLDPARFELRNGRYIQRLADGTVALLTLEPAMQESLDAFLVRAGKEVPFGAVVAIEPATGRVRAMVTAGLALPKVTDLALRAAAPSASVFKWVTATALMEAGVDPKKKVCYSGGLRHLAAAQIAGPPGKDRCAALDDALAESLNVVISRLAYQHLTRRDLERTALAFGFNQHIPFELPVAPSTTSFSDDEVERARTAAGFWNVDISPLHGAMIAAAFANGGVMMRPTLVERLEKPDGTVVDVAPRAWKTVTSPANAKLLGELAKGTTRGDGTAAKAFHKRPDWPDGLEVTGKTGTLSNKRPFFAFTWFIGFAPLDAPELAVAGLVANEPKWWIKGMHGAARAILAYRTVQRQRGAIRDAAELIAP